MMTHHPPSTPDDIDRIIDLYYYEAPPEGTMVLTGSDGAYCYYGPAAVATLGGTGLTPFVDRLAAAVASRPGQEDFRVTVDGRTFRVCRDDSNGVHVSCRRLPKTTPLLSELKLDETAVRDLLLAPWLNDGGLVMFCGLTGQGKTTFASATVRTRLELYGGRCVAVEDVPELPLHGIRGRGSCHQIKVDYQTEDPNKHGFNGAVRRAYRSLPATRPAILYVGEVRDAETAQEVVKAAGNGMLVITTTHAGDPASALLRLITLAEAAMGESARMSVAQALRLVVHSSLVLKPDVVGWERGRFTATAMVSDGPTHAIAHLIRKGDYSQVMGVVEGQQTRIKAASAARTPAPVLLQTLGSRTNA